MKGGYFVNYEILTEGTGLVACIYDAKAGVGRTSDERDIFKDILKSGKLDYYICEKSVYLITTNKYDILFKDLTLLERRKGRVYFKTSEGEIIHVTKQNFSVRCYLQVPNCPEAWVQEYIRKPK